jgi:hypothetical protein
MRRAIPAAFAFSLACGGASPPPPSSAEAPSASDSRARDAKLAPAPQAPSSDAYDDPDEAHDPATLAPLFDAARRPAFPKATVGEHECWQTVALGGVARKDFEALVAKCGAATGSVEYTKPNVGKLHHVMDKRDTYVVHVQKGLCYRFFGVADATVPELDIMITRGGGALVGEDRTKGPVAIIESDKAWCIDRDDDLTFVVQAGGTGAGGYVFGVWARPPAADAGRRSRPTGV